MAISLIIWALATLNGIIKFMKKKHFLFLVIIATGLGVLVWLYPTPRAKQSITHPVQPESLVKSNLVVGVDSVRTNAGRMPHLVSGFVPLSGTADDDSGPPDETNQMVKADSKHSSLTNWPQDDRPAVKAFYAFAQTAKLYNFDPQITYFATNSNGRMISVATKTYNAEFVPESGRIPTVISKYDAIESMGYHPEAKQSWTENHGTWDRKALIEQTELLLQNFAFPGTQRGVAGGRREVKFPKYTAPSPSGKLTTYYPFAVVVLHDATHDEQERVTAEYRFGTDGTPQLASWYAW